jgi:hypothetical protein
VLATAAGCSEPGPDRVPGPNLLDDVETPVVADIAVDGERFSPDRLELQVGEAFELTNDGNEPVRVVGTRADEQRYDTGSILPGEATIVAFGEEGRYTFTVLDAGTASDAASTSDDATTADDDAAADDGESTALLVEATVRAP